MVSVEEAAVARPRRSRWRRQVAWALAGLGRGLAVLYGPRGWRASAHAAADLGTGLASIVLLTAALLPVVPLYLVPPLRRRWLRRIAHAGDVLARWERQRIRAMVGARIDEPVRPVSGARQALYAVFRGSVGIALAVGVALTWSLGVVALAESLPLALLALLAAPCLAVLTAHWDVSTARNLLAPSGEELLTARVQELFESRAGVVEAVDAERRRIERDLHDGVQQRLVALSILLGRAERAADRDPVRTRELLRQARQESLQSLRALREVSWRVFPAVLDDRGLDPALSALASRSSVPVTVCYDLAGRLPRHVESVAYFVVSEAVTNAVKHANATAIRIQVSAPRGSLRRGAAQTGGFPPGDVPADALGADSSQADPALTGVVQVEIVDDGIGGADPAGAGLAGLARRVAAVDGTLRLSSPAGGGTIVRAELPCGS